MRWTKAAEGALTTAAFVASLVAVWSHVWEWAATAVLLFVAGQLMD